MGDTSWQSTALELTDHAAPGSEGTRRFEGQALSATLAVTDPDIVDLNGGYLHSDLQPLKMLSTALARAGRRPEAWQRPPQAGLPELRDWFATDIGAGLSRHEVTICAGGQSALATVMRALAQPGDAVIVEAPAYPGTIAAARAAGLRTITVPLDDEGIRADLLESALTRTACRLIVVQPLFHNPTGVSMSSARRERLLDLARAHSVFVVEDDFARHLAHPDARPAPPLIAGDEHGVTVHIRSLTKITSPNLRLAAIAARGPVMERLRAALVIDSMLVPAPLQYTGLEVVTSPSWQRTTARLLKSLLLRRETAVRAVEDTFGPAALAGRPRGGYHLWVSLPRDLSSRQFAAAAMSRGVSLTPAENYFAHDIEDPFVRISYVAAPSVSDLDQAIRRLGELLPRAAEHRSDSSP